MPQIFPRRANTLARLTLPGAVLLVGTFGAAWHVIYRSPFMTRVHDAVEQPVPFSHKHHVSGLGIDCRYCHSSVEESSFAGIPDTATCMSCHSELWTDAELLQPVRRSLADDQRLKWNRVHDLPDFVYFDHSIHIAKGIGCSTCHGRVDQMPITRKANTLYMKWCLECHREPERFVRPRDEIFRMDWSPDQQPPSQARELMEDYDIQKDQLTDCSICHR